MTALCCLCKEGGAPVAAPGRADSSPCITPNGLALLSNKLDGAPTGFTPQTDLEATGNFASNRGSRRRRRRLLVWLCKTAPHPRTPPTSPHPCLASLGVLLLLSQEEEEEEVDGGAAPLGPDPRLPLRWAALPLHSLSHPSAARTAAAAARRAEAALPRSGLLLRAPAFSFSQEPAPSAPGGGSPHRPLAAPPLRRALRML